MMVAIDRLLQKKQKKKKSPLVFGVVVVVTLIDRFRLLRVLLRTIMADKWTYYRDVALPAAADAEVAIQSSLFLSSSPSPRHNSYFRYRFRKYSFFSSVVLLMLRLCCRLTMIDSRGGGNDYVPVECFYIIIYTSRVLSIIVVIGGVLEYGNNISYICGIECL